jgi:hypothetical protein
MLTRAICRMLLGASGGIPYPLVGRIQEPLQWQEVASPVEGWGIVTFSFLLTFRLLLFF